MAIVRRGEATPVARRGLELDPFQMMRDMLGWDPFQGMAPRLWTGAEGQGMTYVPSFDVKETSDAYVFKVDLPGFREQDLDLNVSENRLTVSGKREEEKVEDTDTFYCRERSHGSFMRTFTLPEGIDSNRIQADLKEGILSIHVPKSAGSKPKRISIGGTTAGEKKVKA